MLVESSVPLNVTNIAGLSAILALTFAMVYFETVPRTTSLLIGAALTMVWGDIRGFLTPDQALASVSLQTLMLLVTMTIIAQVMASAGVFTLIGLAIAKRTGGNRRSLFILISMFTFCFSTVADNLTVM